MLNHVFLTMEDNATHKDPGMVPFDQFDQHGLAYIAEISSGKTLVAHVALFVFQGMCFTETLFCIIPSIVC